MSEPGATDAKTADGQSGRLALIASRGTRSTAAPVLLIATAAANAGWEVGILWTFQGITMLKSELPETVDTDDRARASDQAYGPFGGIGWPIPGFLTGEPPAFSGMATEQLDPPQSGRAKVDGDGVDGAGVDGTGDDGPGDDGARDALGAFSLEALRASALEAGVSLYACDQSMLMLGVPTDALMDGLTPGGAAAFLSFSLEADVSFAL